MGCGASSENKAGVALDPHKPAPKHVHSTKKDIDEFEEHSVQPLPAKDPQDAKYKNGVPTFHGEEVTPCFDNGLLYRIVKGEVWAFYNDTRAYEMHVDFTFGKNSQLRPLGNTKITQLEETGEFQAIAVVYPGETSMYVKGSIAGLKSRIKALPLSEEYLHARCKAYQERSEPEMEKVKSIAAGCGSDDATLAKCVEQHIPFVDLSFPPSQESLTRGSDRPMKMLPWARPDMYLPDGYAPLVRLFRNKISALSIDPGDLGDCWVMCALACLAEHPELLKNVFRHPTNPEMTHKERAVGAHRVSINKNGWWRSVIVDNYFPVIGGKPKYGKTMDDQCEMWVSVLEKAYAKVHGSYASITSGDPLLALQDLTGFPTTRYDESFASDTETGDTELLERLERYDRHGFKIVLSTPCRDMSQSQTGTGRSPSISLTRPVSETEARYKEAGLMMGHAYTVRRVLHREMESEKISLVQICNPWLRGVEWKGDWSRSDAKWEKYPAIAEECKADSEVEGTFWMSWKDVQSYFNGCGVLFAHPSSIDYRIRGVFEGAVPSVCVQFTVKKKVYIGCILSQDDNRGTGRAPNEYPPIMLSLSNGEGSLEAMRVEQNTNLDADHPTNQFTFMRSRDVGMLCTLTPEQSPYLLVPRVMTEEGGSTPYTIGLFSDEHLGSAEVRVEFRALPSDSTAFNNVTTYAGKTKTVSTEYQVRHPGTGFPHEGSGKEIVDKHTHRRESSAKVKTSKSGKRASSGRVPVTA